MMLTVGAEGMVRRKIPAVEGLVGTFDRRGTEPFELFRSEFGQNSGNFVEFFFFRAHRTKRSYQKTRKGRAV